MKRSLEYEVAPPDVRFLSAGRERDIRAIYGPNAHRYHSLHLITAGSAHYYIDGVYWSVKAGQCISLPADTPIMYHTDFADVCTTHWVTFRGSDVLDLMSRCGFGPTSAVINVADPQRIAGIIDDMLDCAERTYSNGLRLNGLFSQLLATIIETSVATTPSPDARANIAPKSNEYITRAMQYIYAHMDSPLHVGEIAEALFISRTYLYELFQEYLQTTPQLFVAKAKTYQACEWLRQTGMSVQDIAESCGYRSAFAFSKAFKRIIGMSPREYRQRFTDPANLVEDR
ncbi:helix-turn-helix transcriptional regulator [Bifidobacterium biavatii]|uniref:AraC family transcriptional regulator n=1 Tax=Bifidobacterium biavatii DSM 23969 TaxID=1437608 RepID=A0A086ZUW3_9BIFI|nr:AraC family transcriptional regulator [Bifidobacterium biavatii]KFI50313.1 AraC family transcriptional regulator [Bifidobacterium biavatii DSM 23969]